MTDNQNRINDSESLAVALDEMISKAVSEECQDIIIIPQNKESERRTLSDVDGVVVIPHNAPAQWDFSPKEEPVGEVEEPLETEEPVEEIAEEPEVVEEPEMEDVPEIEEEPEVVDEPEVEEEPEIEEEPQVEEISEVIPQEIEREKVDNNCLITPRIRRRLASEVKGLLAEMDADISRITVVAPSGNEPAWNVALLVSMGIASSKKVLLIGNDPSFLSEKEGICPTDMENLFVLPRKEDLTPDLEGYEVVVDATGSVTADCGVLIAVKPKVTTYGAYRRVLKSLKKSQAKIIGAVMV